MEGGEQRNGVEGQRYVREDKEVKVKVKLAELRGLRHEEGTDGFINNKRKRKRFGRRVVGLKWGVWAR